jgi:hypothetical protein
MRALGQRQNSAAGVAMSATPSQADVPARSVFWPLSDIALVKTAGSFDEILLRYLSNPRIIRGHYLFQRQSRGDSRRLENWFLNCLRNLVL